MLTERARVSYSVSKPTTDWICLAPGVNIIEVKRDGIPAEQYKVVVR